jgi:hypothetical protein
MNISQKALINLCGNGSTFEPLCVYKRQHKEVLSVTAHLHKPSNRAWFVFHDNLTVGYPTGCIVIYGNYHRNSIQFYYFLRFNPLKTKRICCI